MESKLDKLSTVLELIAAILLLVLISYIEHIAFKEATDALHMWAHTLLAGVWSFMLSVVIYKKLQIVAGMIIK